MNNVHLEGGVRHDTSRTFNVPICTFEGPPPLKKGRAYCAPSVYASGPHDALALGDLENSCHERLSRTQTTSRRITDLDLQKNSRDIRPNESPI